jgi:two-component system sensor histidine kinase KdpD
VLELLGPTMNGATAAQILLLVLIIDARFFGTGPAVVASLCAAAGFSRYFVTPSGFTVGDPSDLAALAAFIIMAVVVGELASSAERRAREAHAGRQEVARLYQELQGAFDRASEVEAERRSEQVKAGLLDALTHNLRTPLTAIKASVTALLGDDSTSVAPTLSAEGQRELLEVIDEESNRLNRYIEGLSAAGSDTMQPLNRRAVAPGDLVRMGLARAETLTRDYRVDVDVPPILPTRRRSLKFCTSCSTTRASTRRPARRSVSAPARPTDSMSGSPCATKDPASRLTRASACSRNSSGYPAASRTTRGGKASASGYRLPGAWSKRRADESGSIRRLRATARSCSCCCPRRPCLRPASTR